MWIGGLSILRKPFAHLHTQFNRDLPWGEIDMDFMNLNQAAHGDREAWFLHARMRMARKSIVGHWEDPEVQERLGAWMRVARGWQDQQGAKFARFGDNMRRVAVTEGDKVDAEIRFGYSVDGFGVGDLAAEVEAVAPSRVTKLCSEYDRTLYRRPRPARPRRPPRLAPGRGEDRARAPVLPRERRLQGVHHHLRGPARPPAASRPGRPAADVAEAVTDSARKAIGRPAPSCA